MIGGRPVLSRVLVLALFSAFAAAETLPNWTANYPPCNHHVDLLQHGPINLGIRLATTNQVLAEQFKHALDFWSKIVDLEWHEDDTDSCSLELADGRRDLFEAAPDNMVARSQFPDRLHFEGWIAFNPAVPVGKIELYRISVHEIGHVLGLRHSPNTRSLMYGLDLDSSILLDADDLATLAAHHKLRISSLVEPIKLTKLQ